MCFLLGVVTEMRDYLVTAENATIQNIFKVKDIATQKWLWFKDSEQEADKGVLLLWD